MQDTGHDAQQVLGDRQGPMGVTGGAEGSMRAPGVVGWSRAGEVTCLRGEGGSKSIRAVKGG